MMCALSNKPKRGGATRLRPEMGFVGEKVWGFLRWMGSFDTPVTEQHGPGGRHRTPGAAECENTRGEMAPAVAATRPACTASPPTSPTTPIASTRILASADATQLALALLCSQYLLPRLDVAAGRLQICVPCRARGQGANSKGKGEENPGVNNKDAGCVDRWCA